MYCWRCPLFVVDLRYVTARRYWSAFNDIVVWFGSTLRRGRPRSIFPGGNLLVIGGQPLRSGQPGIVGLT